MSLPQALAEIDGLPGSPQSPAGRGRCSGAAGNLHHCDGRGRVRSIAAIVARTACRLALLSFLRCCTMAADLGSEPVVMRRPRFAPVGSAGFRPE